MLDNRNAEPIQPQDPEGPEPEAFKDACEQEASRIVVMAALSPLDARSYVENLLRRIGDLQMRKQGDIIKAYATFVVNMVVTTKRLTLQFERERSAEEGPA